MGTATDSRPDPAVAAQGISLRTAIYILLTPVFLSLAMMATWPERYGRPGQINMSTARLGGTLGLELVLGATLGGWLWYQGWRPHRTATYAPAARDLARGLGVWLAAVAAYIVWALLCRLVTPDAFASAVRTQVIGRPPLGLVVVVSAVNAVFEEFLWLGLGVAVMRRVGVGVAAMTSIGLRTLVHAYQGPLALVAILPVGTVFTVYYTRTRRIWPVVLAHGFQDLLSLGLLAKGVLGHGAV